MACKQSVRPTPKVEGRPLRGGRSVPVAIPRAPLNDERRMRGYQNESALRRGERLEVSMLALFSSLSLSLCVSLSVTVQDVAVKMSCEGRYLFGLRWTGWGVGGVGR